MFSEIYRPRFLSFDVPVTPSLKRMCFLSVIRVLCFFCFKKLSFESKSKTVLSQSEGSEGLAVLIPWGCFKKVNQTFVWRLLRVTVVRYCDRFCFGVSNEVCMCVCACVCIVCVCVCVCFCVWGRLRGSRGLGHVYVCYEQLLMTVAKSISLLCYVCVCVPVEWMCGVSHTSVQNVCVVGEGDRFSWRAWNTSKNYTKNDQNTTLNANNTRTHTYTNKQHKSDIDFATVINNCS